MAAEEAGGTVLHVYGLLDGGVEPSLPPAGIGGAPVALVTVGPVAAVVSELDDVRFGAQEWRAHADDPEWLGRVAGEHNAVLQALVAEVDVLPLRLPSLHRDRAELEEVLRSDAAGFEAALAEVRGHVEWGAKIFLVRETDDGNEAPAASGRDYLMRKASQASRKEQAAAVRQRLVLEVHEELSMAATHAAVNAPQDRALSGRREPMLLNAAYLVPRERGQDFLTLADRLADGLFEQGMTLEVSGPWPPYNFAGRSGHPATGAAP
jgi:hypothetical protein